MLEKEPGYLGYGGIIAIHANWPNYPSGIGWKIALKALGNFPRNTKFYEIDDIDRCKLLINQNPFNLKNPTNDKYYHTSIWHSDLVELHKKGFIKGIVEKSDYEFELIKFEKLKISLGDNYRQDENENLFFNIKNKDGALLELRCAKPSYDENHWMYRDCAIIPNAISLTNEGFQELKCLSRKFELSEKIELLTKPLLNLKRYDTAIREASLLIESSLKEFHNTNKFGQHLIEFHINDIVKNNGDNYSAVIKCYRGELRTIFKFIRNDFAHNFKILREEQCRVILQRIDQTYNEFKEVVEVYYDKNNNT